MYFIAYGLIFMLLLLFSWMAFFQASADTSFLYQPLRSFLLILPTEIIKADFFLADNFIKAKGLTKILNELLNWFLVISFSIIFVKILDLKSWFLQKKTSYFDSFLSNLRNISKVFKAYFNKERLKLAPLPRTVLDLSIDQITKIALFVAALSALLLPADSSDLFGYIARGSQQADWAMNPFATVVAQIENWRDYPLLTNLLWERNPSPYGPLFMVIVAGLAKLASGNLWLALFLFKLHNFILFAIFTLAMKQILCDDKIAEIFYRRFDKAKMQKILYSLMVLNPFIMVETLWNGHNDIYLGLGIVYAIYLAFNSKYDLSVLLLILCTLIKYIALVLIPLVLIASWQEKKMPYRGILVGSLLSAYLINYYHLFDAKINKISHNIILSHKSFYDVLNTLYSYVTDQDLPNLFKYIFIGAFMVFAFFLYYKFHNEFQRGEIFKYAFYLVFVLLCIASPKFHSWYLVMILPLMSLVYPRLCLLLSLSHLFSLTFLDQARIANFLFMTLLPFVYMTCSERFKSKACEATTNGKFTC